MDLRAPHLSKSRYLSGLQCDKRLWLGWHEPGPRGDENPGSILALGTQVGEAARLLFPDGVLVGEGPREFAAAEAHTRNLLGRNEVTTIFEAAFAHEGVVVRADIIRRAAAGGWDLIEVKSSTTSKREHVHDLAVQAYVLRGAGIDVRSMQLMYVNRACIRNSDGIPWQEFFRVDDLTVDVEAAQAAVPERLAHMQGVLQQLSAPEVGPSRHCFKPFECEFWPRCTAAKPQDWVFYLPRLRTATWDALAAAGIERMSRIPPDFGLTPAQQLAADCAREQVVHVAPSLAAELASLGPPCSYLDFETGAPAIPLYLGTHPYQRIAFQWSLQHDDGTGCLVHHDYLADCRADPRREFAETLIAACAGTEPILVYSAFESAVVTELAQTFADLASALNSLRGRFFDLLPVVRRSLVHTGFRGSYSIKAVATVLADEVNYSDLGVVADGAAASAAFYRLATERLMAGEDVPSLRTMLRRYCARDTLALASVHRALIKLAAKPVTLPSSGT